MCRGVKITSTISISLSLSRLLVLPPCKLGGLGGRSWLTTVPKLQRLGDCIGKGAFGSVYKAFNWGTGEAVAVKQIKIADVPKSELRMIEVNHPPHTYPLTHIRDTSTRDGISSPLGGLGAQRGEC